MATLVLSTVGTALGGPVGGAIGALIGQSLDQEILGPSRRGPRVGDLSVQSSSYGTQIPRVYGTMRVAGSVVWATDLVESNQTTGAKGQPDTTYSYSVSFAVALSSRPLSSIGRIWADGKLLRGTEGDFKVSTTFRFYEGGEDQAIDPLIGSVEGIANTPAYRGLGLAVFEDLELADYGNRIPFLTFEVLADLDEPNLAAIFSDASGGAIACDAAQAVVGYAAYGRSIAASIDPLLNAFGLHLFDDGSVIRGPGSGDATTIGESEFGNGASGDVPPKLQREQSPPSSLPASVRLSYYDPSRDFQTAEARAAAGEQVGNEIQHDLPAVLSAEDAKSLAQGAIARSWAQRDKIILRLPPARIGLEPGTAIELPLCPAQWIVQTLSVESFVPVAELRPAWTASAAIAADAGRVLANVDVVGGPVTLALLDMPDVTGEAPTQPTILLAASAPSKGWKRHSARIDLGGQIIVVPAAGRKSILGTAATALAAGDGALIDLANSVEVQLIDPEQWLTSCDDQALSEGANLALLGDELLHFGEAASLGDGRFRLARLLRARGGTEWATASHAAGEPFCMIQRDSLQPIAVPAWCSGATIAASPRNGPEASVAFGAESLRPRTPVHVSTETLGNGDLVVSWTRRSRNGWGWIDEVDVPLGESREQYRVNVTGRSGSLELSSEQPAVTIGADALAQCGTGAASVEIRQLGDGAASRPAQVNITIG